MCRKGCNGPVINGMDLNNFYLSKIFFAHIGHFLVFQRTRANRSDKVGKMRHVIQMR